jgi:hypothetical protein
MAAPMRSGRGQVIAATRFGDCRRRAVGGRFGTDSIRETPRLSRRIRGFIVSVGQQTPPALALGILDWFYR